MLTDIKFQPRFTLMKHQADGVEIAKVKNRFGFFDDTGTGKTLTGLSIFELHNVKTLIICPLSLIQSAWLSDIEKWMPELLPFTTNLWLMGKSKNKAVYQNALNKCRIGLINYEAFKNQIDDLKQAGFKMVILDESSKVKSPKTAINKAVTKFCSTVRFCYLFSGTPAPNTLLEYIPQMIIIDQWSWGRSFYAVRNKFFHPHPYLQFKWIPSWICGEKEIPNSPVKTEFYKKLSSCSRAVHKEDVLDLPERTFNIRYVDLSSQERKVYKQMVRDMLVEIEEKEYTAVNAAVKIMKLREITSGFLMGLDNQANFGTSKLDALEELLDEIGEKQVIIWYQFHFEASEIIRMLINREKNFGRFDGTVNQEVKQEAFQNFKKGKIQYLLAHPRSMGHGVDGLQAICNYAIYYSLSYSLEEHYQSLDRIYRNGQKNACSYYFLIARDSIDEHVYAALQGKKDALKEVLNFIKQGR